MSLLAKTYKIIIYNKSDYLKIVSKLRSNFVANFAVRFLIKNVDLT